MKSRIVFLVLLLSVFLLTVSSAEVPRIINYQGKLTTQEQALVDTTIPMSFAIYSDSIGTDSLWSEAQASVSVRNGVFSVLLGSVNPIPDSVFDGDMRYLGIKVDDDSEMIPRRAIVSVGYAYKAEYADTAEYAKGSAVFGCLNYLTSDTIRVVTGSDEWNAKRSFTIPPGAVDQGIIVIYNNRAQAGDCGGAASWFWTSYIRITANSVTKGTSYANAYEVGAPGLDAIKESGLAKAQFLAITDLDWGIEQTISLDMKWEKSSGDCGGGGGVNDSWLILGF